MSRPMDEKERFFRLLDANRRKVTIRFIYKKANKYIKKKKKLRIERDLINGLIEDYEKQYGVTIARLQ